MENMSREELINTYGPPPMPLTNDIPLRIYKDTKGYKIMTSAVWLLKWLGEETLSLKMVWGKLFRTAQKASKLRGARLEQYKNELFTLPNQEISRPSTSSSLVSGSADPPPSVLCDPPPSVLSDQPPTIVSPRPRITTPRKRKNMELHETIIKQRRVSANEEKLKKLKDEICALKQRKGHYSMKNTKRRDKINLELRQQLRKEIKKMKDTVNKQKEENKKQKEENERLQKELNNLRKENIKMSQTISTQRRKMTKLKKAERAANGRAEFHKQRRKKEHFTIQEQTEEAGGTSEEVETMDGNGQYTANTRFCVMELMGLDVATGKVAKVMETVGDMLGVKFLSLPSKSACQRIADEGHVLVKDYIRDVVLKECTGFGLHKDGTTRRKVKILDTSVRTKSGEEFGLGWSAVVSETGAAIAEDAREKLQEVMPTEEDEMVQVVRKIEYYMNDRAANEKKSCRLLDDWRTDMLESHGEVATPVCHLHCAAHVLIGFHTYVVSELKKLDIVQSFDAKHPIALLLKDASDVFGPAGDYRGMKTEWESYCESKGKRSYIKNYKDNRFNGLFECSAQVFHHHQDFLKLLEIKNSKNAKQARLCRSLLDPNMILITECLGLFFHSLTGPYWTLSISSKTTFPEFKKVTKNMRESLEKVSSDPSLFFTNEVFSLLEKFKACGTSEGTKEKMAGMIRDDEMGQVMKAIADGMLKTMNMQLTETMEGEDVTVEAPLTNLVCERHFGILDASQKRRPNASLHHHTTVLHLKQTGKRVRQWYKSLSREKQEEMIEKAKRDSKEIRERHQRKDRAAVLTSLKEMPEDSSIPEEELKKDQWIAVACEDAWYPALVQEISIRGEDVEVSFAELGKTLGIFRWPTGKDINRVSRKSIVDTKVEPEPRAGGRIWSIPNAKEVQAKFNKFK